MKFAGCFCVLHRQISKIVCQIMVSDRHYRENPLYNLYEKRIHQQVGQVVKVYNSGC